MGFDDAVSPGGLSASESETTRWELASQEEDERNMLMNHKVLVVDDEPNILTAIERVFFDASNVEITTASSAAEALDQLQHDSFSAVISDYRMPVMTGVALLAKVKELSPNTVRIMLTGFADMSAVMDAINLGEVHRFLTKPWDPAGLRLALEQSLLQFELRDENQRLHALTVRQNMELTELNRSLEQKVAERTREILEKNVQLENFYEALKKSFRMSIEMFSSALELYDRGLGKHCTQVALFSRMLAVALGLPEKEIEQVEFAARLHDIGLIGVPKEILTKPEPDLISSELDILRHHPELGQSIVGTDGEFAAVGTLIRGHHERFDGRGFPDGLARQDIPVGARIIAIGNAFARALSGPIEMFAEPALKRIQSLGGTYFDPEFVKLFSETILKQVPKRASERELKITELQPGMTLSKDVCSSTGWVLLPGGTVLNSSLISRLRGLIRLQTISPSVHVFEASMA